MTPEEENRMREAQARLTRALDSNICAADLRGWQIAAHTCLVVALAERDAKATLIDDLEAENAALRAKLARLDGPLFQNTMIDLFRSFIGTDDQFGKAALAAIKSFLERAE